MPRGMDWRQRTPGDLGGVLLDQVEMIDVLRSDVEFVDLLACLLEEWDEIRNDFLGRMVHGDIGWSSTTHMDAAQCFFRTDRLVVAIGVEKTSSNDSRSRMTVWTVWRGIRAWLSGCWLMWS